MTRAEILAIGDELVHGHALDTNSTWIARELEALGIEVLRHTVVSDLPGELEEAIRSSCARADLVVATGGLGPTEDDRTRGVAAAAAEVQLVFDERVWQQIKDLFAHRDRSPPESNRLQAWRPETAEVLPNRWGTAPGFAMAIGGAEFIALPGVPREMRKIVEASVIPRVRERFAATCAFSFFNLHVIGPHEAELGQILKDLMASDLNPRVGVTAHKGQLTVRIVGRGESEDAARVAAEKVVAEIRPRIAEFLVREGDKDLVAAVGHELICRGITLAAAESCTGGKFASRLTDVEGISQVFLGSWVTYSNEAKTRDLGVPEELISRFGAVSEEVAAAMAAGAAERSGARMAVSVTGIAGPGGGSVDKPVGLVCFGLHLDGATDTWQRRFTNIGRRWVRERSVLELMAAIHRRFEGDG
jgi:nicotinamide-nucleotide amidase